MDEGMKIGIFLPIAAGQVCLLFYRLMGVIWAFPNGFLTIFKNCPEAFGLFPVAFLYPFNSAQRLSK
jgi:hypothetical protein